MFSKKEDGNRQAVILDATIFHPQGGGQPADTGVIVSTEDDADGEVRFLVEDVRSKDGVVRNLYFIFYHSSSVMQIYIFFYF